MTDVAAPTHDERIALIRERLDLAYVKRLGQEIRGYLLPDDGLPAGTLSPPVVTAYTPGNMTRYDLVFVPLAGAYSVVAPTSGRPGSRGYIEASAFRGTGPNRDKWVVVGWENHGCAVFPILDPDQVLGIAPGYAAGAYHGANLADGVPLVELFRAIAPDRNPA